MCNKGMNQIRPTIESFICRYRKFFEKLQENSLDLALQSLQLLMKSPETVFASHVAELVEVCLPLFQ